MQRAYFHRSGAEGLGIGAFRATHRKRDARLLNFSMLDWRVPGQTRCMRSPLKYTVPSKTDLIRQFSSRRLTQPGDRVVDRRQALAPSAQVYVCDVRNQAMGGAVRNFRLVFSSSCGRRNLTAASLLFP